MTIPIMNFPTPSVSSGNVDSLLSGLNSGLQLYSGLLSSFNSAKQMEMQRKQSDSQLGLSQSEIDLNKEKLRQLQNPSSVQMESQIGKITQDYHNIQNIYGENSPETKQAKNFIDSQIKMQNAMADSRNTYAQGFGEMVAPQIVREQRIKNLIDQGYSIDDAVNLAIGKINPENISKTGFTPESLTQSSQIGSEIYKKTVPVDVQKREFAGARAEMTLKNMNQFIDQGALDYIGLKGKGKLKSDELSAMVSGKTPLKLQAYRNLQGQLNVLKDEYATTLGVPADQISRSELGSLFDINQYSTNPEAAKKQLENIGSLLNKTEDINFTNLYDLSEKNKKISEYYDKNNSSNPLEINSSKLENLSPSVNKQLGINKTNTPSLNNREEFIEWYKQQSPEVKAAYRKKLGG